MRVKTAVEDLSRMYGRPTLGRTVYFLEHDNGRVESMHDTWEAAMDALLAYEDRAIVDDWWGEQPANVRHAIRREFNRLPMQEQDHYRGVSHYGFITRQGVPQ